MISRDTIRSFNNKCETYFAKTNSRFTYVAVILSLRDAVTFAISTLTTCFREIELGREFLKFRYSLGED